VRSLRGADRDMNSSVGMRCARPYGRWVPRSGFDLGQLSVVVLSHDIFQPIKPAFAVQIGEGP